LGISELSCLILHNDFILTASHLDGTRFAHPHDVAVPTGGTLGNGCVVHAGCFVTHITCVSEHSLAVGAFITRYGSKATLTEAADLFLKLLAELTADANLRPGALEYGMTSATWAANDRNASQAHQLRGEFLKMLFSAAIAERVGA
jgi:hypothetical protein